MINSIISFLTWSLIVSSSFGEKTENYQKRYAIGDRAHGGIVIYVDPTGQHGVVCAPVDQKFKGKDYAVWGCLGKSIIGARRTAMYTGAQNTKDITKTCTKGETAADICSKLRLNGFSDWYLPAKGELNAIYKAKKKAKLKIKRSGYWSSTGTGDGNAWVQTMGAGFQFVSAKYGSHRVRAVRKF